MMVLVVMMMMMMIMMVSVGAVCDDDGVDIVRSMLVALLNVRGPSWPWTPFMFQCDGPGIKW